MTKIRTALLFPFLAVFFQSCAVKVPPAGGPKDTKPPKVIRSVPENSSVKFDKNRILLKFDEFIQVKDLNSQLVSSPLFSCEPVLRVKGKSIEIELRDTLKKNTTYTLNFGKAITDIHENNVLDNFQYCFSTGEFVDSLSISGKILNAQTLLPEKAILVMLYPEDNDSVPIKEKPLYFSKSNADGSYSIKHLANRKYKIFALKDANSNYLYDLPNESIAFSDTLVSPENNPSVNLFLFDENNYRQRLLKTYSDFPGKATFVFKNPVKDEQIETNDNKGTKPFWNYKEYSANKDTLTFWITDKKIDSLHWIIRSNGISRDTVDLFIGKKENARSNGKAPDLKLYVGPNFVVDGLLESGIRPEIRFSQPVRTFDFSRIRFMKDSIPLDDLHWSFTDSANRKIICDYMPESQHHFQLMIPSGAFTDIFGISNDTIRSSFKTKAMKEYGSMSLKITLPEGNQNYIIQLLDEKENVVKEDFLNSTGMVKYSMLNPGKYRVKMILDSNKNKRWDTGIYLQKKQPEKVLYYLETISIRANWDLDQEWKL